MVDNIIGRLVGETYHDFAKMEHVVILRDPKTGEQYNFRFNSDDVRPGSRVVCAGQMLIAVARNRLAKQWGSIYG